MSYNLNQSNMFNHSGGINQHQKKTSRLCKLTISKEPVATVRGTSYGKSIPKLKIIQMIGWNWKLSFCLISLELNMYRMNKIMSQHREKYLGYWRRQRTQWLRSVGPAKMETFIPNPWYSKRIVDYIYLLLWVKYHSSMNSHSREIKHYLVSWRDCRQQRT